MSNLQRALLIFCLCWHCANSIPKSQFYPFGLEHGDEKMPSNDEGSSPEISLQSGHFTMFHEVQRSAYINLNGLISFDTDLAYYNNQDLSQFSYPLVAGFYADIDTHLTGREDVEHGEVFYRQTNDTSLLERFRKKVIQYFADSHEFKPRTLLIATWDQVGYYDSKHDKVVTFQIVLAMGRLQSYVELLYADEEVQWTISEGKDPSLPDIHAQIGFSNDDGRSLVLPWSGKPEVINITRETNMGVPGNFLFRVSGDRITAPADVAPKTKDGSDNMDGVGEEDMSEYDGITIDEDDDDEFDPDLEPPPTPVEGGLPPAPPVESPDEMDTTTIKYSMETSENSIEEKTTPIIDFTTEIPEEISSTTEILEEITTTEMYTEETTPEQSIQTTEPIWQYETTDQPTQKPRVLAGLPIKSTFSEDQTCQGGIRSTCNQNAECRDYQSGACCQCREGYYGNGINCLAYDEAQRIDGKVYGRLNGIDLGELDLHTYAETRDSRAYTSISRVEPAEGRAFLLLSAISNIMGWFFGKITSPNTYNGFELTGGVMNRTASIHIGDHHMVTLQQEFLTKGSDQLKVQMYITGTVPDLPENASVNLGEIFEEYTRPMPGVAKSYSTNTITVNVADRPALQYAVTVDQTMRYDECRHKPFDKLPISILQIERSYVYYETNEKIVRYASANRVNGRSENQADPCRVNDCTSQHMSCVAHQNNYRCVCLDGYQLTRTDQNDRRGICVDIDECASGAQRCHLNANCQNTDGGYTCSCKADFVGNGYSCERDNRRQPSSPISSMLVDCGPNLRCHKYAECLRHRNMTYFCSCPSTDLDGRTECEKPEAPLCSSHGECHNYGACVFSQALGHYRCECRPPYVGDGRECVSHGGTCDVAQNCDRNADCVYKEGPFGGAYICRCKSGFSGDGYSCNPSRSPTLPSCNTLNTCSPNAICVSMAPQQNYQCQCKPGFKGDGYRCEPDPSSTVGPRSCQSQSDCHASAHCISRDDNEQQYFCECLPGFRGDGIKLCEAADQCNPGVPGGSCPQNAECRFDDRETAYVCRCRDGFYGDGRVCQLSPPPAPPVPHRTGPPTCRERPDICHREATCLPDAARRSFACRCNPGYTGDGATSCQLQRELCNGHQVCDQNARCEPDQRGENRCQCNPGFQGDGLYCTVPVTPAQDCLTNSGICDPNANCVQEGNQYQCRCNQGYHGNGLKCTDDADLRQSTLVFTQGMSLVQRGLAQTDLSKQLAIVPYQIAVGVDFDCRRQRLYWTDISGHAIRTANADGSNVTLITDSGLDSPEGVAVDYTSGNIYYSDSGKDTIGVIRVDGMHNFALIKDGLVNPRALAIDFTERKLYYSDWNRERPIIGRAGLDGSEREVFISEGIMLPNGLVVLHRRRELCWVDAGTHRIECISIHGSSRRIVYAPVSYGFGLTVKDEQTLFWTDWEDKKIHSVSIFGDDHKTYEPAIGSSAKMYGIVALSEECSHAETRCMENNGGCPYLCLPDSRGNGRCVCPENVLDPQCNVLQS